jgi:hypothetical protein
MSCGEVDVTLDELKAEAEAELGAWTRGTDQY